MPTKPTVKKSAVKKPAKKKVAKPQDLVLVELNTPTLWFLVQEALTKTTVTGVPVTILDARNGKKLVGQVDLSCIGLTTKQPSPVRHMGFRHNDEPGTVFDNRDMEAILHFRRDDPERPAGYISAIDAQVLVLEVLCDQDVDRYTDIAVKLATQFVETGPRGKLHPHVLIEITSLCRPDPTNPDSAINAILGERPHDELCVDMPSGEDDYCDDEGEDW